MLEDAVCRCRDTALGWGRQFRRTASLMIGQPDYDAYVRHAAARHPDAAPMDRKAFFRLHEERRFGAGGTFKCC
ncbi:YbdD/YjiX family protein [Caulobacter segnis]|uniref:YbdD/YjiX family protein n=1 Tax=Caulobacter segnis TaxID=88688 RepID=UPI00240F8E43|nr:YbdD/YjiX family protein [Caulobacter segnis]MDG2520712.1 YbdD/YjiX family protein [Caulobacter segnis]